MGTNIRPEIKEGKRYWISRHRYYELKHFCLQYPEWKKEYQSICGICPIRFTEDHVQTSGYSDSTFIFAEAGLYYSSRIEMVEEAARRAHPDLQAYILKAVTQDLTYIALKMQENIPCCRDVYYEVYRKFFWELSNLRK